MTSGEVLIDGINIKSYSLHSIRGMMSIVTQEPILFNDTIANNIRIGKETATDEEITDAAKVANAHNFIIQKEEGYTTNIGDRGGKLSGGERQRLKSLPIPDKTPPSFFGGAPDGFLGGGELRGGGLDRCPVGGVERRAEGVVRR